MNMLTSVMIKIGPGPSRPASTHRACCNNGGQDDSNNMNALKTAHSRAGCALHRILPTTAQGGVSGARDAVIRSRTLLLELWAKGDASKAVQTDLSKAGVATAYVEPLLTQTQN
jgi:hypothetical protein